jgi:ligand-binding sensor domain-containing protein/class 3 adenylate cyclase
MSLIMSPWRKSLPVLRILAFICVVWPADLLAQRYDFRAWSVDEGLPRSSVYHMAEDAHGLLWVATEGGGLASFDGHTFNTWGTAEGLASNMVRCVLPDAQGRIWAGTDGNGISILTPRGIRTIGAAQGLANAHVRSMAQAPDGRVWAATYGGGLCIIDLKEDTVLTERFTDADGLPNLRLRAVLCDSKGRIWAGTDGGLCRVEGRRVTVINGLIDPRVLCLYEDREGAIWAGTEHGAARIVGDSLRLYMDEDGLPEPRIRSIVQDAKGRMWFATQKGVWYLDGNIFRPMTEANGLSNARVRSMVRDRQGNLWFGTWFGGICRFSGADMALYRGRDGLPANQVTAVLAEADTVWVGTLNGLGALVRRADGQWAASRDTIEPFLIGQQVNCMSRDAQGRLWVGTDAGILIRGRGPARYFAPDGDLLNDEVRSILIEPDGKVWVGSSQGVTSYLPTDEGHSFHDFWSESNANESSVGTLMRDAKGRIWAGFERAAVVRHAEGQFSIPAPIGTVRNISHIIGGPQGQVCIATHGSGIHIISPDGAGLISINRENGLTNPDVNLLAFDRQGQLWAGSSTGLDRIAFGPDGHPETIRHMGTDEGFFGTETFDHSVQPGPDGTLWVGTVRGLTAIGPQADGRASLQPITHITRVATGSGIVLAQGLPGRISIGSGLILKAHDNTLVVDLTGIDLSYPEKVRYQWRIVGLKDEWSALSASRTERFDNLPAGSYTFVVRACNADGLCDATPEQFKFRVLPPFWRTWWFIVGSMLLGAMAVWGIIRYRERMARAERMRLQHMVDERTRDLQAEKQRSDDLLHNILPHETAQELKATGTAQARHFDTATILFTDFKGFTQMSEKVTAAELVEELNLCFKAFDGLMEKYRIEKIKTIGDAYMAAGGLPDPAHGEATDVVRAALEMQVYMAHHRQEREAAGRPYFEMRVGIHSGPVVAGIVGVKKFQYDIWGDTVNTASRMESSGEVGRVNISEATYQLVKDHFHCEYRGEIEAKGKGRMGMWFVS